MSLLYKMGHGGGVSKPTCVCVRGGEGVSKTLLGKSGAFPEGLRAGLGFRESSPLHPWSSGLISVAWAGCAQVWQARWSLPAPPRPCFGLVRSGGAQRPEPPALLLGSEPSRLWQEVSTGPEELVPCGGGGSLALGETGSG